MKKGTEGVSSVPRGHVKLARKAFDLEHGDPFWLEQREFSRWEAWVDVIQLAAFRTYKRVTDFGVIELHRGEFVASLRWLADRWLWTVKKVRMWVATCEKGARLRAQRETQAGTVYLVVNYDTYQNAPPKEGTSEGTAKGTAGAQQGHKKEAVKAVKAVSTSGADAPRLVVSAPAWPEEGAIWWQETVGRMSPGRFGVAIKPFVDRFGWDAVKFQLVKWVTARLIDKKACKIEWFADECSALCGAPQLPDVTSLIVEGWMSPELERATRPK